MRFASALIGFLLLLAGPGRATIAPSVFPQLAFDQRPGAALPLAAELADESGTARPLAEFFAGRPVVIVLEYLRCPNLCGLVLGGLFEGLAGTGRAGRRDYDVLAISIDPGEGPAEAAAARASYAGRFGVAATAGWQFLTGREEAVRQIADAIGFRYRLDPAAGQFAHAAGLVIASPAGRVSRYLLGIEYRPLDLKLALAEASDGTVASPASRLLLLCYGYDPKTGSYTPAVMGILRGAALATIALGGTLLFFGLRRGPIS